ncbi:MAG: hypothetical protein R3E89_03210 [Thiolinea sp.]
MLALKKELASRDYFTRSALSEPNLTSLLDLVALGTVADVVPLDANNRILVEQDCAASVPVTDMPESMRCWRRVARPRSGWWSSDFFVCGPRLNAAGGWRIWRWGIRCLLTG